MRNQVRQLLCKWKTRRCGFCSEDTPIWRLLCYANLSVVALFLLKTVLDSVKPLVVEGITGTETYTPTSYLVIAVVMVMVNYMGIFGYLLTQSTGLLYGRWSK